MTACIVAAAPEYQGQVTFGGMPLPGAMVTVTQGDKKFVAIVDQQGTFSFPDLTDGTWTIQIDDGLLDGHGASGSREEFARGAPLGIEDASAGPD